MPRNRLPRVMKHYSPTGRMNHGRPLKRLLDTWDRNGSTSGPTPWQIYDDDDYYIYTHHGHILYKTEIILPLGLFHYEKKFANLKYNQKDATFPRSIYFYKLFYMFQAVPPPIIRSTKLYIQRQVLSNQYCYTIAAGSSIGLTIPDAVCTVLCSWWCAEEPPETCRAIYRNKQIEKTLHIVGCTLEIYLRCTDI